MYVINLSDHNIICNNFVGSKMISWIILTYDCTVRQKPLDDTDTGHLLHSNPHSKNILV